MRTISSPVLTSRNEPVPYVFLASPGSKQVWPNSAACWSPRMPDSGRPPIAEPLASPYVLARGLDLGQHRARHAHQVERLGSCQSSVSRSISSVRLALVTSVTWRPPSLPPVRFHSTQLSVVPNAQLAVLRPLARAVDVVEQPRDLRAGEVGGERQAGDVAQPVDALVAGQLAHEPAGAGVLPDDRVVDRLAGLAVPHHGRLALVGDADRLDVARLDVGVGHRAVDHRAACSARSRSRRARPSPPSG